jgi:hypothetical protein
MIKVVCNITTLAIFDISRSFAEVIPNAGSTAVYISCTFNLVRGSGHSPCEVLRDIVHSARSEIVSLVVDLGSHLRGMEVCLSHKRYWRKLCQEAINFSFLM